LAAAAIVSWHPVASFQQRWVSMPASNQLGNARPRHESFGASFVLHAAQMPGRLKLSLCELGATSNGGPFYFPGNFD